MTAGAHLREERLRQHLSLEEIGRRTSVHLNNLRAIEEDDLASLPAPVFVRGFIRLYARELGIDPRPPLALFDEQYGGSGARHDVLNHPDILSSESLAESPFVVRKRVVLLVILLLVAVAVFGYRFTGFSPSRLLRSYLPQQQVARPPVQTAPAKPAEMQPSPATLPPMPPSGTANGAAPSPHPALPFDPSQQLSALQKQESFATETAPAGEQAAKTEVEAAVEAPSGSPPAAVAPASIPVAVAVPHPPAQAAPPAYRLVADFTELTWVRVTVDEEPSEEGLYKPGTQQVWTADDGFRLTIGNTGGLTLTLNGQPVAIPASPSKVAKLALP